MQYNPPEERICINPKCSNEVVGAKNKEYCDGLCADRARKARKRLRSHQEWIDEAKDFHVNGKFNEAKGILLDTIEYKRQLSESKKRKDAPVNSGFMQYFPNAIMEVARLSKAGNDKHNPNEPLHWAKQKSNDHGDCLCRHQLEVGTIDSDGFDHAVKVAWRAMAQLEILLTDKKE